MATGAVEHLTLKGGGGTDNGKMVASEGRESFSGPLFSRSTVLPVLLHLKDFREQNQGTDV